MSFVRAAWLVHRVPDGATGRCGDGLPGACTTGPAADPGDRQIGGGCTSHAVNLAPCAVDLVRLSSQFPCSTDR